MYRVELTRSGELSCQWGILEQMEDVSREIVLALSGECLQRKIVGSDNEFHPTLTPESSVISANRTRNIQCEEMTYNSDSTTCKYDVCTRHSSQAQQGSSSAVLASDTGRNCALLLPAGGLGPDLHWPVFWPAATTVVAIALGFGYGVYVYVHKYSRLAVPRSVMIRQSKSLLHNIVEAPNTKAFNVVDASKIGAGAAIAIETEVSSISSGRGGVLGSSD